MSTGAIDTPDFQHGVISAQKLLAKVPAGTDASIVAIPINAETLVVVTPPGSGTTSAGAVGVTTGVHYPGYELSGFLGAPGVAAAYFDISGAVDDSVNVTMVPAPTTNWYIYADAAVHLASSTGQRSNGQGIQYVIPSLPSTAASDHPLTELKIVSGQSAVDTAVLPAAPAGQRYRIFSGQIGIPVSDVNAYLADSASEMAFCVAGGQGSGSVYLGPSGFPLTEGAGVSLFMTSSGNPVIYMLSYTLETV